MFISIIDTWFSLSSELYFGQMFGCCRITSKGFCGILVSVYPYCLIYCGLLYTSQTFVSYSSVVFVVLLMRDILVSRFGIYCQFIFRIFQILSWTTSLGLYLGPVLIRLDLLPVILHLAVASQYDLSQFHSECTHTYP